jgi:autophagy-related protein 16
MKKTKALDLLIQEHQTVKAELEQALAKLKAAEDENEVPYFPSVA